MIVRTASPLPLTLSAAILAACDGASPPPPSEGVDIPEGPCGHALYVVSTDYQSTTVAVVGWDGAVLEGSIVSSGSATSGLSVPFSGDVVAPSARSTSGSILLLDRYPTGVVSVIDPTAASVDAQIDVRTGFSSNPQDILEVAPGKAYVSRYGQNPDPGATAFDAGSDLVIVRLDDATLTGRVDLSLAMDGAEEGILPRPSKLARACGSVFALLSSYSADFLHSGDGRIATIDPESDRVVGHTVLEGARGCSTLAVSPSGHRLAVSCSGTFGGTSTPTIEDSALLVLSVDDAGALHLESRIAAADLGDAPLAPTLAFATDDVVLAGTLGAMNDQFEQTVPDRLLEITLSTGAARELLRSETRAFTLGDARCELACGACFVADADHQVVQRFSIDAAGVSAPSAIPLDDGIGLPPRYLGAF